MDEKARERYISELEEKIVDLTFKLKSAKNELNESSESNLKVISKLAHNLKNPIGLIVSFSEIISEDIESGSTEKLSKYMEIIQNSAKFSLEIINSSAKITQLKSGKKFNFSLKNYIEVIEKVISKYRAEALKKHIEIKKIIPEKAISVLIEEEEMMRALGNVIDNAIRFSDENSTITITVSENKNTLETTIADEGLGISEENLSKVFYEFFVVNTYSANKQKCVGLGLSIANEIVKSHHGEISVLSTLEKGSEFKITLPKEP